MKNYIIAIILYLFISTPTSIFAADATHVTEKELKRVSKTAEKEAKSQVKQWIKEGWIINDKNSLELKVKNFIITTKIDSQSYEPIVSEVKGYKSLSAGESASLINAIRKYAHECGKKLNDSIVNKIPYIDIDEDKLETLIDGFEVKLAQELNNELFLAYEIFKEDEDGTFELNSFYTLNKTNIKGLKLKAFYDEAKLMNLTTQETSEISYLITE